MALRVYVIMRAHFGVCVCTLCVKNRVYALLCQCVVAISNFPTIRHDSHGLHEEIELPTRVLGALRDFNGSIPASAEGISTPAILVVSRARL